jgi:energy-coupling factor transporter ATP-binding protein EcfA2
MSLIQKYLDLNWEILPIRNPEKIPYVEYAKYKNETIKQEEILNWLSKFDRADWAVLTGKDNRVLLDFDDPNIYYKFFKNIITKKVMITPSGGVSCIIKSSVVPRSCTHFNGFALDIKGPGSYAVIPSLDLNEEQIEDEKRKEDLDERPPLVRRWLNFDTRSDDEFVDIESILTEKLPKIETDVKKGKNTPSAIKWAKEHGIPVKYEGHGYIQVDCFLKSHNTEITRPNLAIYDNGYYCFSCGGVGGLYSLIKEKTGLSDSDIKEQYPDVKKQKKTAIDHVVDLIESKCSLVKDQNNNSFLKLNDYTQMGINLLPVNSKISRYWIASVAEEDLDKLPNESTLAYVIRHLDAKASAIGDQGKIYRRIGGDSSAIWYDLGGNSFAKITKDSFGIYPETPLTFMRETNLGIQTLPASRDPKNVMKLFKIVNVPDAQQQILIISWLVNAFLPWAQWPILLLCGSRGSGKSWLARILKRLVDPVVGNASELLVNKPRDLNYLIHLISHNALGVLDNMSFIDQECSDTLCNVVTGGVVPTRQLYTTNDSVLIDVKSRIIITAINREIFESGTGDLAERTISVEIDRPEGKYITEEALTDAFDEVRADILGGLLSLVQGYLKDGISPHGTVSEFRMTTYSSVGKYVEKVLKITNFDAAYRGNQLGMSRSALDSEPITDFILWYARKYGGRGIGCTVIEGFGIDKKQLYDQFFIEYMTEKGEYMGGKKYPKTARTFYNKLKRITPDLLKIFGISIINKGIHRGKDWILISQVQKEPDLVEEEIAPEKEVVVEQSKINGEWEVV